MLSSIIELWNGAWPAALTMSGLGSAFAVVLLIASEKLKVEEDPKIERIHQALPNIDCGACGYAGCGSYAKAVSKKPDLIGLCAPGGAKTADAIASVLNLQISNSGPAKRPVIHCRSHNADKTYYAQYHGIESCTAANALAAAQACKFGCMGFGDCVSVCKFDAVHVIDGLATIDYEKCTGCGACAKGCPRNLIKMVPFSHENMLTVSCNSRENGKTVRATCKVGCIACSLCTKQTDIFSIEDNLAHLDYEKYEPNEQTETAFNKCPTKVIILVGKNAPPPQQPAVKKAAQKA